MPRFQDIRQHYGLVVFFVVRAIEQGDVAFCGQVSGTDDPWIVEFLPR